MKQVESLPTSTLRRAGVWIRRWPVTTWAICALALLVCLTVVRVDYDSSPFGLLVITEAAWGWMYWVPTELLSSLNGGRAFAGLDLISAVAGLSIAAIADILLRTLTSRLSRVART